MEFEPFRRDDCLRLVDCLRSTLSLRTPDGCVPPLSIKAAVALLECLEAKLGGERRGPQGLK